MNRYFCLAIVLFLGGCSSSAILDIQVDTYSKEIARSDTPLVQNLREQLGDLISLRDQSSAAISRVRNYQQLYATAATPAENIVSLARTCERNTRVLGVVDLKVLESHQKLLDEVSLIQQNLIAAIEKADTATVNLINESLNPTDNDFNGALASYIVHSHEVSVLTLNFQEKIDLLYGDLEQGLRNTNESLQLIELNPCGFEADPRSKLESSFRELVAALNSFYDLKEANGRNRDYGNQLLEQWPILQEQFRDDISEMKKDIVAFRIQFKAEVDLISDNLRDIVQARSFYNSQLDRLQDPAHIAWIGIESIPLSTKEVIDEASRQAVRLSCGNSNPKQHCWAEVSRARFYAEGRSDVVAVEERVGNWKIKQASNFPAALIKGQLEISRSLASGATKIISSIAGVSSTGLSALDSKEAEVGTVDESTTKTPVNTDLFKQSLLSELESERKDKKKRALRLRLQSLEDRITLSGTPTPLSEGLREEIRAVLELYSMQFDFVESKEN